MGKCGNKSTLVFPQKFFGGDFSLKFLSLDMGGGDRIYFNVGFKFDITIWTSGEEVWLD